MLKIEISQYEQKLKMQFKRRADSSHRAGMYELLRDTR